jgi:hypothetical protein
LGENAFVRVKSSAVCAHRNMHFPKISSMLHQE